MASTSLTCAAWLLSSRSLSATSNFVIQWTMKAGKLAVCSILLSARRWASRCSASVSDDVPGERDNKNPSNKQQKSLSGSQPILHRSKQCSPPCWNRLSDIPEHVIIFFIQLSALKFWNTPVMNYARVHVLGPVQTPNLMHSLRFRLNHHLPFFVALCTIGKKIIEKEWCV